MKQSLRVARLLLVLAFVALGAWTERARSASRDDPIRVAVYPINAGGTLAALAGGWQDTGAFADPSATGPTPMTTNLGGAPILDWQQANDLIAYQEGRPAERLHTDVDSIYAAIRHRLARHGPLDVGDDEGNVIGRLELDDQGRLRLQRGG